MDDLNINSLEEGCLMCLHYFGIFKYPLTAEEVHRFNPFKASLQDVENKLEELKDKGKVFNHERYYLEKDDKSWIAEREEGFERASGLLARSAKYVRIIASFPFVKGIAISGSLSKFYASSADPDIDYFIITESSRLWIARSFLHFFKKLTFITRHQHYFCMNYFIDTEALTIDHRNMYSAIEVKTLLPVFNKELFSQFENMNTWSSDILPNHPGIKDDRFLVVKKRRFCKKFLEGILNILFPDSLNRFFMKITDSKWRKKWRKHGYSPEEYNRAFRTELHISKNHPMDYEKKVLESLPDNLESLK